MILLLSSIAAAQDALGTSPADWNALLSAAAGSLAATAAAMAALYQYGIRPHVERDLAAQLGPLQARIAELEKHADPERARLREQLEAAHGMALERRVAALEEGHREEWRATRDRLAGYGQTLQSLSEELRKRGTQ